MRHDLKTWPEYFDAVSEGRKRFEVRRNDRDFRVGDVLVLRRWCPASQAYNGDKIEVGVTYVLAGGQFGIEPDHVVLGLSDVE